MAPILLPTASMFMRGRQQFSAKLQARLCLGPEDTVTANEALSSRMEVRAVVNLRGLKLQAKLRWPVTLLVTVTLRLMIPRSLLDRILRQ